MTRPGVNFEEQCCFLLSGSNWFFLEADLTTMYPVLEPQFSCNEAQPGVVTLHSQAAEQC